jgi:hypothetical protein
METEVEVECPKCKCVFVACVEIEPPERDED